MNEHQRCVTGIEGLDDILAGGLPVNRIYLLQGDPGAGKTTMALQFLLEGVRRGENVLYVTLSETKEELHGVAESHGWNLEKINLFELSSEDILRGETENTFFHPSDVELDRTIKTLLDEMDRVKPVRLVFDSLAEMRMLAETPLRFRRQIMRLRQNLTSNKCTVLLLDDRSGGQEALQIESITHGVIRLQRAFPGYGVLRRQVQIQKVRGVKFREGNHDFVIEKGGVVIFPRLVAAEHHTPFKRESFASGIKELDALLGGGLDRGTSNMFIGPPGTGKSTLALLFALVAARHREKAVFFSFDETIGTLTNRAQQLGMDLTPYLKDGTIEINQIDPAEISPGELAHQICQSVSKNSARMIVIDSINGYLNAMPEENYLNLQLHELLAYLNQQGIVTLMILAQQGLIGNMQSAVDLTYLADTVVALRFFEAKGAVRQALAVIKKRSGAHERTIREMVISKTGIEVGAPLTDLHGVLTGTPSSSKIKMTNEPG